jgi:hypothetical protein
MDHEPKNPIRLRLRQQHAVDSSSGGGPQPAVRVLIRVPYVGGHTNTPGDLNKTTALNSGSAQARSPQTTVRFDPPHNSISGPHIQSPAWMQQPSSWIAGVLQSKKLLAIGLIIGGLVIAIVVHQRSGHDTVTESAAPRPQIAKSDRHASLRRKSADTVSLDSADWGRLSNGSALEPSAQFSTGRRSLAATEPEVVGPLLFPSEVPVSAAANTPARLNSTSNPTVGNQPLVPRMPDLQPPREAAAVRSASPGLPNDFRISEQDKPALYEARLDPTVGDARGSSATRAGNVAFEGNVGSLPPPVQR